MNTRIASGLSLVAVAVAIVIARLLVTDPGCSGQSFDNWSGWLYVIPATGALAVGASVLVTARSERASIAVAAGAAAAIVGGLGIFFLAVIDDLDGCVF